jgi:hypothetical protein
MSKYGGDADAHNLSKEKIGPFEEMCWIQLVRLSASISFSQIILMCVTSFHPSFPYTLKKKKKKKKGLV